MLTLLASVAQEESQNLSENIRWRIQKKFEKGIPHTPQDMYGYRWDGEQYQIEPNEAKVIRKVFKWYLDGDSVQQIVDKLNQEQVLTRLSNPFTVASIREFFKQEAYFGRLVLQKTYREAFSRNPKRNKGQRNKYIIENAHEPIVTKEYFDLVLHEKERRYQLMSQESHLNKGIFRDKISCSECGCLMIVKVDSKQVNKTVRYYCRTRNRFGASSCSCRTLGEKRLLASFKSKLDIIPDKEWVENNIKHIDYDFGQRIIWVI
ncbi:recombinase family protein, partial [Streptococcus agalactiae]|nr:recombinase family protein [Streptococcus agalactiae]